MHGIQCSPSEILNKWIAIALLKKKKREDKIRKKSEIVGYMQQNVLCAGKS